MVRFVFGFAFGAAVGAAIVVLVTPQSGEQLVATIRSELTAAMQVATKAAEQHELQLWGEFHDRLNKRELAKQMG